MGKLQECSVNGSECNVWDEHVTTSTVNKALCVCKVGAHISGRLTIFRLVYNAYAFPCRILSLDHAIRRRIVFSRMSDASCGIDVKQKHVIQTS